jgi:Rod binding domain-containing protein
MDLLPHAADFTSAPMPDSSSLKSRDPARVLDAAQQFESLLIGQMLRSIREGGGNWLSSGEDSAGDCATDLAEQQFATLLSRQGGLGLATLLSQGLAPPNDNPR